MPEAQGLVPGAMSIPRAPRRRMQAKLSSAADDCAARQRMPISFPFWAVFGAASSARSIVATAES